MFIGTSNANSILRKSLGSDDTSSQNIALETESNTPVCVMRKIWQVVISLFGCPKIGRLQVSEYSEKHPESGSVDVAASLGHGERDTPGNAGNHS